MRKFTENKKICILNEISGNGCPQSDLFIGKVELFFKVNSYFLVNDPQHADVLIFNTCGGTDTISKANTDFINKFVKSGKIMIIFGCLCKISQEIRNSSHILISNEEIDRFSEYFQHTVSIKDIRIASNSWKRGIAYNATPLFISQGCAHNCSYCNIKIAKGDVKSRSVEDIIKDVMLLIEERKYEIVFMSDDCGSYGYDIGTDIAQLVDRILGLDQRIKIRIYYIHPFLFLRYYLLFKKHIFKKRITAISIPIQSGSPRVLKLMNRSYDLHLIIDRIKEMKIIDPDIQLYSDFIINFPTETTNDFKKTMAIARYFDRVFFIVYGDNIQTPAAGIFPKCSIKQLQIKKDIFELCQKKGLIKKGEIVLAPPEF